MKKNIGIVYGGYSSEYKISIKSGEFIFKILNNNPDWNVYKSYYQKIAHLLSYWMTQWKKLIMMTLVSSMVITE